MSEEETEEDPLENPDRECNNCGNTDWNRYEQRKPGHLPGDSDVIKHYYVCTECDSDGYIYEEGGHLRHSGKMR